MSADTSAFPSHDGSLSTPNSRTFCSSDTKETPIEDAAKIVATVEATARLLESESRVNANLSGQSDSLLAQLRDVEDKITVLKSRTDGLVSRIRFARSSAATMSANNAKLLSEINEAGEYLKQQHSEVPTPNIGPLTEVLSEGELEARLSAILAQSHLPQRRGYHELAGLHPMKSGSKTSGMEKTKSFTHGRTGSRTLNQARDADFAAMPKTPLGRTKSSRILFETQAEASSRTSLTETEMKAILEESQDLESSLSKLRGSSEVWQVYSASIQASLSEAGRELNVVAAREESLEPLITSMDKITTNVEHEHAELAKTLASVKALLAKASDKEWESALEQPTKNGSTSPSTAAQTVAPETAQDDTSVQSVVSGSTAGAHVPILAVEPADVPVTNQELSHSAVVGAFAGESEAVGAQTTIRTVEATNTKTETGPVATSAEHIAPSVDKTAEGGALPAHEEVGAAAAVQAVQVGESVDKAAAPEETFTSNQSPESLLLAVQDQSAQEQQSIESTGVANLVPIEAAVSSAPEIASKAPGTEIAASEKVAVIPTTAVVDHVHSQEIPADLPAHAEAPAETVTVPVVTQDAVGSEGTDGQFGSLQIPTPAEVGEGAVPHEGHSDAAPTEHAAEVAGTATTTAPALGVSSNLEGGVVEPDQVKLLPATSAEHVQPASQSTPAGLRNSKPLSLSPSGAAISEQASEDERGRTHAKQAGQPLPPEPQKPVPAAEPSGHIVTQAAPAKTATATPAPIPDATAAAVSSRRCCIIQ